ADTRASIRDMLVQSAPIGIAFIDRELRIETVNDALARMNRAPREAHIGRHVTEVSNLPISHEVIAILERVLETGEAATDLDFSWPKGPRTRHVRVSIFPIAPDGTVAGLGITVTDV